MKLSDLRNNETAFISTVGGSTAFHLRLEEMGFVPGQEVTRVYSSPLGTPIVYAMLGQRVALRRREAKLINAEPTMEAAMAAVKSQFAGLRPANDTPTLTEVKAVQCHPSSCAGCPGCGTAKRSERTRGERREGVMTIALVGNPNCGKTAFFNAAAGGHERTGNYAGVTVAAVERDTTFDGQRLCIVDLPGTYSLRAFSPEEAYVANELARGDIDAIINVIDVTNLERNLLLTLQLKELGIPMVGVLNIYDEFETSGSFIDLEELSRRLDMPLVPTVAKRGRGISEALKTAIKTAREEAPRPTEESGVQAQMAIARHKAGQGTQKAASAHADIHRLLEGIYTLRESRTLRITAMVDRILTSTPLAYLFFILIMGLIFYATFAIGAYPMEWMEAGVEWLSEAASAAMSEGWVRDLLVGGVLGGVGSVIVFLPNILILYFFISILEDSGYLARAALLTDPLLRRAGLHGKSFIPMIMGFGCSVPAVMATRIIESRKSRLVTMMTLPFMSCSARLPVYLILCGAFFPDHAAFVMLGLYLTGILVAFASAWIMNRCFRREEESHFVMEMPPYRMPMANSLVRHTWEKGRQYLHKMGGIILVASVIIWVLSYFPRSEAELTPAQQQEQSLLGQAGHAITPIIKPLGYDWRMGVGILTGVGAKELMVSTLGVLYNVPEGDDEAATEMNLQSALRASGTTPAAALSYLVFALLYLPCIATIAAIRGESGRWKYALFTAGYTTLVAYVLAFITYQVAQALL